MANLHKAKSMSKPNTKSMTLVLSCACGEDKIIASGYNALEMTIGRLSEIGRAIGWAVRPDLCPDCLAKRRKRTPQISS